MTDRRILRVRAFAFEPRTPPTEIQLWNVGDNPTDYGVHVWTARSAADVFARYETRGNPLLIDVEHNGAKLEDGEPPLTGGYARLEIRAGAPWLVFEWSAYAVEQITTGQRRFLSPEYDVDRVTGEITALYRVSLVADPGTHRARVLAAATTGEHDMDPKLAAIMAILSSVSDAAAAIEAIKSLVANLDGGDAPVDAPVDADAPPGGAPAPDAPVDAGGAPPGDAPDKDKVAAAVKTAAPAAPKPAPSKPVVAVAPVVVPAVSDAAVQAASVAAVVQIQNATRDHLLVTDGDRLDPSIRRWASTQPLAVVSGLIKAAPAKTEGTTRTAATRGATQGLSAKPKGLEGKELEQLQKSMGTFKASTPPAPHEEDNGLKLVLPTVRPSEYRAHKRTLAAAAAGKAGN